METTVKERLVKFIKYKGLSQKRFEEKVGLSNGYVNNIRRSITVEAFGRFVYDLSKLDCFAAKVAQSVDATMGKLGKVASVSSKQAWILACAGIENNITF